VLYRLFRSINAAYPMAVLWSYIAAFFLALALMFVFPQGTLLLLFLGLAGLGAVILTSKTLNGVQHLLARHALGRGVCPNCRTPRPSVPQQADWRCPRCHITFTSSGWERETASVSR
jgi:ribosomal protein L37AE/L43A